MHVNFFWDLVLGGSFLLEVEGHLGSQEICPNSVRDQAGGILAVGQGFGLAVERFKGISAAFLWRAAAAALRFIITQTDLNRVGFLIGFLNDIQLDRALVLSDVA